MIDKMTVLAIDQDPGLLAQFELRYGDYFNIHTSTSLREIDRFTENQALDIFLIDRTVARDNNSSSTSEWIRKLRSAHPHKAILIMGRENNRVSQKFIIENGVDGFLRKPFTIDEFLKTIEMFQKRCHANPTNN